MGTVALMRRAGWAAALLLACALGARCAAAGEITLAISATMRVTDREVSAEFKLANSGNEPASDVMLDATLMGEKRSGFVAAEIAPNGSGTTTLKFLLPADAKGTYPVFVTVRYSDAGGTGFSIASLATARTAGAEDAGLKMEVEIGLGKNWGDAGVTLTAPAGVERATVTCHCPGDLKAKPAQRVVAFKDGKADARFTLKNAGGQPGSRYAVFFTAEYAKAGINYAADTSAIVPIEAGGAAPSVDWDAWRVALIVIAVLTVAAMLAVAFSRNVRAWLVQWVESPRGVRIAVEVAVLVIVELFIIFQLGPEKTDRQNYLFTKTITAGGDTASHYYTAEYMRDVLLPEGKVTSWTPGNYAGFPILQFYFPLPFLTMCGLSAVMPLQVAFKLVTLLGTFLLPIAAYILLRMLRTPFPGPSLGAAFTLPFLFNAGNTMWGANLLSTMAGEFSYSLSLSLALIFLGCLYRGCTERKWVLLNAFLVFLVGFSHGYTLLFAEAMSVFLVITPRGFVQRVVYLAKVYGLGFCLLAFWLVPLLAFGKYTTPYHIIWSIGKDERVIPRLLIPWMVMGASGVLGMIIWAATTWRTAGRAAAHALGYLGFGILMAGVLFVAAPRIGVVDIRYVPCIQLFVCLLAAMALGLAGRWLQRIGLATALLALGVAATFVWVDGDPGPARGWARWNYEGFEAKPAWGQFKQINDALHGTFNDPRVVFEHSEQHNSFGSSRAFESLPLFAGRATLEGLYMQASITAPFSFYIQSEVSQQSSRPFPQYTYATMDFKRAIPRLEMFNVRDLILRSGAAKAAIKNVPAYRRTHTFGEYELWELTGPNRYVEPLRYEPTLYTGADWKRAAHQWFITDSLLDTHVVFIPKPDAQDMMRFQQRTERIADLPRTPIDADGCIAEAEIRNEEIRIHTNWIGKPLLVKMSYHPNWMVEGADQVYLVSPSFMLIYPTQENVRLYYGRGRPGKLGLALTYFGLVAVALTLPVSGRRPSVWSLIARKIGLPESLEPRLPWNPSDRARGWMLGIVCGLGAVILAAACWHIYRSEAHRLFNRSVICKDAKQYDRARDGFRRVISAQPTGGLAADSAYYIATTYDMQERDDEAIAAYERLLEQFPNTHYKAEAEYHIAYAFLRKGEVAAGLEKMKQVRDGNPGTVWAGYARDRLREHKQDEGPLPDDAPTQLGTAIRFLNEDRLDEAKSLCDRLLREHPEFPGGDQAMAIRALCDYKQKDYAATIRDYGQLIAKYPTSLLVPEAWFHIGLSQEALGEPIKAQEAYAKAAKYPDSEYGKSAAQRLRP